MHAKSQQQKGSTRKPRQVSSKMTRDEALQVLGLKPGASEAEIKAAYKEMAQILHPDKYAKDSKLAERAEEQFKRVNEARDLLLNNNTHRRAGAGGSRAGGAGGSGSGYGGPYGAGPFNAGPFAGGPFSAGGPFAGTGTRGAGRQANARSSSQYAYSYDDSGDEATVLRAKLAGIAAARVQLVAQRDHAAQQRSIAIVITVAGVLALAVGRFVRILLGLAGPALIWGVIQLYQSIAQIGKINKHLTALDKERKKCESALEQLNNPDADKSQAAQANSKAAQASKAASSKAKTAGRSKDKKDKDSK